MKRIAIVASAKGFHWEELAAAYLVFDHAGYDVEVLTPEGKAPRADPNSIKRTGFLSLLGYGTPGSIRPGSAPGNKVQKAIARTAVIKKMDVSETDAVYLAGGHGALFDICRNRALHQKIKEMHSAGKVLAAVCHATSTFAFVSKQGTPIIKGVRVTGFPNILDRVLRKLSGVDERFLPIPFSNQKALKDAGARTGWLDGFLSVVFPGHVVQDGNFITGTGPKAAARTAREVLRFLESTDGQDL